MTPSIDHRPVTRKHGSRRTSALLGAVAAGAVAAAGALGPVPSTALAQAAVQTAPAMPSFADVVAKVKPAVVSVRVKAAADQAGGGFPSFGNFDIPGFDLPDDHPFQDFLKRFGAARTRGRPAASGSPLRASACRRARASSSPPTASSSPTTTSSTRARRSRS